MYVYTFKQTQNLPITISHAWDFFSNPKNLNEITLQEIFNYRYNFLKSKFDKVDTYAFTGVALSGVQAELVLLRKNQLSSQLFNL